MPTLERIAIRIFDQALELQALIEGFHLNPGLIPRAHS